MKIKSFRAEIHQEISSFQWSADEKKMAFVGASGLYIYKSETSTELKVDQNLSEEELEKQHKLIPIPNLQKIQWLPDKKTVLCVCYEVNPLPNSHPASKIFFYNTETQEDKKWKAIGQHIKKAEITLSLNNDWVAVSYRKIMSKKNEQTTIQIVDLTKK